MTTILKMLVGFVGGAFTWMNSLIIFGTVTMLDVIITTICLSLVITAFVNVVRIPGAETRTKVDVPKKRVVVKGFRQD